MTEHHRATDSPRQGRVWLILRRVYRAWSMLIPVVAIGIALIAVLRVDGTVQDIRDEGIQRRDQQCIVFERFGEQAINAFQGSQTRLADTLDYLKRLPPSERKNSLNRAIKANVPQLQEEVVQRWKEAKAAKAPPYCDRPGVGLPEPNPRLPPRPRFSP